MTDTPSLVDQIRAAAARVASRARHIRVNEETIPVYAAGLPEASTLPGPDPKVHVTEGPAELRAAFFLTLDAINFGSGWFPTLRKRQGRSGYYTVAMGLRDHFTQAGAWSAGELAELTPAAIAQVLDQDPGHELMARFAASLNDLGRRLEQDYGGDFLAPVEAADGSAVTLATELAGWDCFRDVSSYWGMEVPLFKRAQIAAADLHGAKVASFGDLHRLTLFADNLVPHVLRLDGILSFETELVRRIEAGVLIDHDSPEEVEMRCGAIHAAELIAEHRPDLTPQQIDNLLWHRGGGRSYKAVPRPRCRCTAY